MASSEAILRAIISWLGRRDLFQLPEGEDDHEVKQAISTIREILEEPDLRTSKSELFSSNSDENLFGKIT